MKANKTSRNSFLAMLGVAVISLGLTFFVALPKVDAQATRTPVATATRTQAAATSTPTAVPAVAPAATVAATETVIISTSLLDLETHNGIPVGFTAEGFPFKGDPNAPVVMSEFSDFLCPFCARHFNQTWPVLVDNYILTGKVLYVFRDFPIPSLHPTAPTGHQAALCVAEQGAPLFWEMHDQLFARQSEWDSLPDPTEFLAGVAKATGADMDAYTACMDAGHTMDLVEERMAVGDALGLNATPSFIFTADGREDAHRLIGAYPVESFAATIAALIAGDEPPQDPDAAQEPAQLPYWANAEGLRPDPERPGYTLAGDQYKGDPDAPLVIVEFSDFQCPSCARHALETQPALDEAFIDTGDVMWVFKHRPLKTHAQAPAAAAAAECAAAQDQFWPMRDLLFARVDGWAVDAPDAALVDLAAELDLDPEAFAACLQSRASLEPVLQDLLDAEGIANATPTFVFLYSGSGYISEGTKSAEGFQAVILDLLQEAQVPNGQE